MKVILGCLSFLLFGHREDLLDELPLQADVLEREDVDLTLERDVEQVVEIDVREELALNLLVQRLHLSVQVTQNLNPGLVFLLRLHCEFSGACADFIFLLAYKIGNAEMREGAAFGGIGP